MEIYNTLSGCKEKFVPIKDGEVKMYVCGPTVYDYIHIGNARPMIFFDTVRRYLEYKGYKVTYVSNYTDVDDKIIKKAIEEGTDATSISKKFIKECEIDMDGMNIGHDIIHPKATEEIPGMIDMIQTLIDKGHAYVGSDGTVYYRVRSFDGYGKLSHKNLDDLKSGFRTIKVRGEEDKEDPNDFVLWKPMKEGEPYWSSPWCDGRPGWHIECSEMSKKYLGDRIDIHGGGEDLIFPHHENEIAQSEGASGRPFVNYWMHNAFLNINGSKMSKSLGNFFTVRDISKQYDLQVLRFFMLSAHYRSPLNFSAELMESAKASLDRIVTCVDNLRDRLSHASGDSLIDKEQEYISKAQGYIELFDKSMDDDFNTADAISYIFELVRLANSTSDGASKSYLSKILAMLDRLCDILGIVTIRKSEALDDKVKELIDKRQEARKNKDFDEADRIRDELLAMGIILEDTREGVKWKKA